MKKVLIFCDYFGNGGIEKVSINIKDVLEKSGYDVKILTTIFNSQLYDKCLTISNKKTLNPIYRFFKTMFNIRKYTKNYEIIHINMHSSINLLYACLISKSKQVVVHAHNSDFQKDILKIKKCLSFIFKKLFNRKRFKYLACSSQAAVFCFGKSVKYNLVSNSFDSVKFIYNEEIRKEFRKKYNIDNSTFVIGHIGRFSLQKNHKFLIEIFNEFSKLNENSLLFMIGDGEEKCKIKSLIKRFELEDKVILLDYTAEVEKYYQMFDCFLFPSLYEGYGICVYEALSSSLKCFVTDNVCNNFIKNDDLVGISLDKGACYWAKKILDNMYYTRNKKNLNDTFLEDIFKIYCEKELISIIVPVYNSSKTIKRCIDSILGQTYDNFELILINDGSTDCTLEIIKEYDDVRIIIINQSNKGAGAARNSGIKKSRGSFITFIDSDDEVLPTYLEELYYNMQFNQCDIACCAVKDSNKKNKVLSNDSAFLELINLPETISISVIRKMFKKNVINNILFDTENHFEDIDYSINAFLKANRVVIINKELYKYYDNKNSRSKYFAKDDRIEACLNSYSLIKYDYPKLFNKYITYVLFNMLGVINMMILNDRVDYERVSNVNKYLKNNIKYVFLTDYPFYKKIQLYLYFLSFNLYKKIYLWLGGLYR